MLSHSTPTPSSTAPVALYGKTQAFFALVGAGISFLFAKHTLATVFKTYDDEGCMLLSLAHYLRHGRLYTEIYSLYGPFYFYAQEAFIRLLRLPVTHDSGRFITLLYWLAAGLLAGAFVYRVSSSLALGSAAALACVRLESVLAAEPGHPQQVVLFLLLLSCFLSLSAGSDRRRMSLIFLGVVGAALMFTKINVGAFYVAALAHTTFCLLRPSRIRSVGVGLMLAYAVLIPVMLMRLSLPAARNYCLIAVIGGSIAFACGSRLIPDPSLPLFDALHAAAGVISGSALIVIATLCQGMSMRTLVQGLLLVPANLPLINPYNLRIPTKHLGEAVFVFACIAAFYLLRNRLANYRGWVGAARCAIALVVILKYIHFNIPVSGGASPAPLQHLALAYAVLPSSLISISPRNCRLSNLFPRLFVADLAVTQFLQAYPVAGSQMSIAAAPLLLWAFVSIFDGVDELRHLVGRESRSLLTATMSALIILALSVDMIPSALLFHGYRYPRSNLSGSSSLHLPPQLERPFGFLAASIRANCHVLFTMPGLGSFNFWSGVPAPNGWNFPAWTRAFGRERQQEILDILRSDPRACVIYNKERASDWPLSAEQLSEPLTHYILNEMSVVAVDDGYDIRVNPMRASPWIDVAPTIGGSARSGSFAPASDRGICPASTHDTAWRVDIGGWHSLLTSRNFPSRNSSGFYVRS